MTNDMYVGDNCNIVIHCRGHMFTVSELFTIAQNNLTQDQWGAHEDDEDV